MNVFAVTLVMLAAMGCEKNESLTEGIHTGKTVTLSASINNGTTKSSLGAWDEENSVYPVLWSDGDAIAVVQNGVKYEFNLSGGEGTTKGSFTCNDAGEFNQTEPFIAYYPYSAVTVENDKIICNIPVVQQYAESSFGKGSSPMSAVANGSDAIVFNNLFGLFKLNLKGLAGETVSKIQIGGNRFLSGNGVVLDSQSGILNIPVEVGTYSVMLNMEIPVPIEEATEFLVALPAGTQELAFMATTSSGVYYRKTTQTIEAGKIKNMALIDLGGAESEMRSNLSANYSESNTAGILIGTKVWAPVNCGYKAADGDYKGYTYGKMYQWGRKYGQGYDKTYDATAPYEDGKVIQGPVSMREGQEDWNAQNFYSNDTWPRDWLDTQDDYLWVSEDKMGSVKTDYDPCPDGWRVATMMELRSLTSNRSWATENGQYGCWFSGSRSYSEAQEWEKVFFPAAGSLKPSNGKGDDRGGIGNYWTSDADGKYAMFLIFTELSVAESSANRAGGSSVRCVKE